MAQRILFGDVEVIQIKTNRKYIIRSKVFKENEDPQNEHIRKRVLSRFKEHERQELNIVKFRTETAKYIGDSVD